MIHVAALVTAVFPRRRFRVAIGPPHAKIGPTLTLSSKNYVICRTAIHGAVLAPQTL